MVPGFDAIIGQTLPVRILQTFLNKAMVPQALLFTGKAGVGKQTTAMIFAMALKCHGTILGSTKGQTPEQVRPCGRCQTCLRVAAKSHPDVISVAPRKAILRIDQIRGLRNTLAMKPFDAGQRVVIISDAHCMNPEAGNALLKVLEEPPPGTTLILTAHQRSDLLPTIVSRCQHIRFNPLPADAVESHLINIEEIDPSQAKAVAALADGSLTKARQLAVAQGIHQRDWLIRAAGLERPGELRKRPITLALGFAAQLAAQKDDIEDLLEVLKSWIRDLSIWPHAPENVINGDRNELLAQSQVHFTPDQLLALWTAVEKAQKDIAANANLRLTLDVMSLNMAGYSTA